MSDKALRKALIKLAHANPDIREHILPLVSDKVAGCEKLPEGPMRDNCEKSKDDGGVGGKGKKDDKGKDDGKKKDDGKMPPELLEKFKAKKAKEARLEELRAAGCEKLPEALRENCEKAQEDGKVPGKKAAGNPKSLKDLSAKEQKVAEKMKALGYLYIAQITVDGKNHGEPLYFKSADKVGPFLRSFPDSAKAKTAWSFTL